MNAKDRLGGLGGLLFMAAVFVAVVAIGAVFFRGAAWASTNLLPWFSVLSCVALGIAVFILLPLAIPQRTRRFASVGLFVASYVFGVTLWMGGFLSTLAIWGARAVVYGLLLLGVGVVPMGMIANLLKGRWDVLVVLAVLTVLTFGSRFVATTLEDSLEGW